MKILYSIINALQEEMCVMGSNVARSLVHQLHQTQRLQKDCGSIKASAKITWH